MRQIPWLWLIAGFVLALIGTGWYITRVNSSHPAIWAMVGGDSSRANYTPGPLPQKPELLWSYDLSGSAQRNGFGRAVTGAAPVVWQDGTIYAAVGTRVHAVGPDGKRKWAWESKTAIISLALGRQGQLYALADGMLYALNPDGTPQWQVEVDVELNEARDLVVGQGGTIYVSGREYLVAVTSTGDRKWRFHGGRLSAGPVELSDGRILVMIRSQLYLLTRDGDTVWERETTMPIAPTALAAREDQIYVSGLSRMILNKESHTLSDFPRAEVTSPPALGKEFIQDGLVRFDKTWAKQVWGPSTQYQAGNTVVDGNGNAAALAVEVGVRGGRTGLYLMDSAGKVSTPLPNVQALAMAPAGPGRLVAMGYMDGKNGIHLIMVGDK